MRSTVWICLFVCAFLGATVFARYEDDYLDSEEPGIDEDAGLIPASDEEDLLDEPHDYPNKESENVEDSSLEPKSAVATGEGNVVKNQLGKGRRSPTVRSIRYRYRCPNGKKRTSKGCKVKDERRRGYSKDNAKQRRIRLREERIKARRGGSKIQDHNFVRN